MKYYLDGQRVTKLVYKRNVGRNKKSLRRFAKFLQKRLNPLAGTPYSYAVVSDVVADVIQQVSSEPVFSWDVKNALPASSSSPDGLCASENQVPESVSP